MRTTSYGFVAEAALTAVLAVGGTALLIVGAGSPPYLAEPPSDRTGGPSPGLALQPSTARPVGPRIAETDAAAGVSGTTALPSSAPITLEIPAVDIRTRLIALGLQPDGAVALPPLGRDSPAGWYRNGTAPGAVGAAVILGHFDSARDGPAVFYRLRELTRGAEVRIHREDGSTAVFTVTHVSQYRKDDFPTSAVYGPADRPVLRLVTCGGSFDRIRRTYRENLVVFADLTSSTPRPTGPGGRLAARRAPDGED